jgi:hypothetical protein
MNSDRSELPENLGEWLNGLSDDDLDRLDAAVGRRVLDRLVASVDSDALAELIEDLGVCRWG